MLDVLAAWDAYASTVRAALESGRLTLDGIAMPAVLAPVPKAAKSHPGARGGKSSTERSRELRARRKAANATGKSVAQPVACDPMQRANPLHNPLHATEPVASVAQPVASAKKAEKQAVSGPLQPVASVASVALSHSHSLISSDLGEKEKEISERDARDATGNGNGQTVAPVAATPPVASVAKPTRSVAIPANCDDPIAWLRARGVTPAPHEEHELPAFADHHVAKGSKFASWAAAWRTWCRNGVRFGTIVTPARTGPLIPALYEREAPQLEIPERVPDDTLARALEAAAMARTSPKNRPDPIGEAFRRLAE